MSRKQLLVTVLSFAAALLASAWVVRSTWPAEDGSLALPSAAHLMALLAVALEVGARTLKISLSAHAIGLPLRLTTSLRVVLGGDFGAGVTPARSGAEPARFLVLREAGAPVPQTVVVLFLELFLELLSIALVAVLLGAWFPRAGRVVAGLAGLVGGYAVFVLGIGAAGAALARRTKPGDDPPPWLARIGVRGRRWARLQKPLAGLRQALVGLREARPWPLFAAFAASVTHVVARLLVLPALVLPLAPHAALAPLLMWPLALFYGGVVAPAPGGAGFIEMAFHRALGPHIPGAVFGAALVWWRFYTFYLYLALGALAAGRTALRAMRGSDRPLLIPSGSA